MKYTTEFDIDNFQFWGGAVDTIKVVKQHKKLDQLQMLIEDTYTVTPSKTDINDFVWFGADTIFEALGIENDD